MTEETKATIKENLEKTGTTIKETGKKIFTAPNLKKGASILILLAVVGAGGKYFLHQNKVEAKNRADEARTTLLQNLAAQKNIKLVSTDDVKNTVAQALGVDAGQVKFTSVNLVSPELAKDGGHGDKYEHGDKHDKGDKHERGDKHDRGDKHEREDKHDRGDKHERQGQDEHQDQHGFGAEQGRQAGRQGQMGKQGQPGMLPPPAPDAATEQSAPQVQDQGQTQPAAAGQQQVRKGNGPLFYSVKCTKDNVDYRFLVGAQNGKILRSSVEPAHSFLGVGK